MFDLIEYLKSRGVEMVDRGPNVKRGEWNIACPFCRDDPGHHMGINTRGMFACWRGHGHCGRRPHRLLTALFGMSALQVDELLGSNVTATPLSTLKEKFAGLNVKAKRSKLDGLEWPDGARRIREGDDEFDFIRTKYNLRFEDTRRFIRRFDMRITRVGPWRYRVLIPIMFRGVMVGWTGRTTVNSDIRYKTWPAGGDTIKRIILNYDHAADGGDVLFVCEGAVDGPKIDLLGHRYDCHGVSILGVNATDDKIGLLWKLAPRYRKVVTLFDDDSTGRLMANELRRFVSRFNVSRDRIPGFNDPGAASRDAILDLIRRHRKGRTREIARV